MLEDLLSSPLMKRVVAALPPSIDIYLVGGAVRDALLGRDCYDLDFVLAGNALWVARSLADTLGGAYYPLDPEREYARIVLDADAVGITNPRIKLDIATYQGPSLEDDLRLRDFTINAMAVSVRDPNKLIDPTGGAADLVAKKLRTCSAHALQNDPVRVLRAVRMALGHGLQILPETLDLMRRSAGKLVETSPERIRDELFRILEADQPRVGIEILDRIGALELLLPEVARLQGVEQTAPHQYDVWQHTLEVMNRLSQVLTVLSGQFDPEAAANLTLGLVSLRLGRFRQQLQRHLEGRLNPDRSLQALLFLSALYHDTGKFDTGELDEHGRLRFFGHDQESHKLATRRGHVLRLSNSEIERIGTIVQHHMRPLLLSQMSGTPTRRAVYRFFRDTGLAGVDICILSLADMLATYGPTLQQDDWGHHLDIVRCLLAAWWEQPEEQVAPILLVNGSDLISELSIEAGPQIGRILEAIREAQAIGLINSREQAMDLAREMIDNPM